MDGSRERFAGAERRGPASGNRFVLQKVEFPADGPDDDSPASRGSSCNRLHKHIAFSTTTPRKHREGHHSQTQMAQNILCLAPRSPHTERVATRREHCKGRHFRQNFEDAPHSSATTRPEHCKGRQDAPRASVTTRPESSLLRRIWRTLHTLARRHAGNTARVVTSAQNFKDAPRASAMTRQEHCKGRQPFLGAYGPIGSTGNRRTVDAKKSSLAVVVQCGGTLAKAR